MSTLDAAVPAVPAVADRGMADRSLGWWGMIGLIATEGTLFSLLLFCALYLRANTHPWPPVGVDPPELVRSGIRSVILLGSSVPVVLAERALKRGRVGRFRTLVITAMVMGSLFLVGHALEYVELSKTLTPTTNAYGSIFYLVTGLHAVHLVVGIVVLGYLVAQSLRGRYDGGGEHPGVTCGLLYWHFVDAVWIAVFSVLYLSERI